MLVIVLLMVIMM